MIDKTSQVGNFNSDDIKILVCKPFSEKYYSYSINSAENFHIIPREDFLNFLEICGVKYSSIRDIEKLFIRFFSFIYFKEDDRVLTLEANEIPDNIDFILKDKIKEKLKEKNKEETTLISTFSKNLKNIYKNLQKNNKF